MNPTRILPPLITALIVLAGPEARGQSYSQPADALPCTGACDALPAPAGCRPCTPSRAVWERYDAEQRAKE
jgi:hypothetical protein